MSQEDLAKQLERIYGIREGSHGEKRANNVQSNFAQEDLAKQLERIYGIRDGSANPKRTEIGVSQTNGLSQGDLAQVGLEVPMEPPK